MTPEQAEAHPGGYTSTACKHGHHEDCQIGAKRWDGSTKRPAECKYCGAPCICWVCNHGVADV